MEKDKKIAGLVREVIKAHEQFLEETQDADCTLCNDAQWWIDNGFSHAERVAFCNSIGCPIPPEGEVTE